MSAELASSIFSEIPAFATMISTVEQNRENGEVRVSIERGQADQLLLTLSKPFESSLEETKLFFPRCNITELGDCFSVQF